MGSTIGTKYPLIVVSMGRWLEAMCGHINVALYITLS